MKKIFYTFLLFSFVCVCRAQEPVVAPYDNSNIPPVQRPPEARRAIVRMGIYGGYSYLTGQTPPYTDPIIKNYYKNLKNGFHLGADVNFFVAKNVALGVKYSLFKTKNEIINGLYFYDEDDNFLGVGSLADRVLTHFIAPNLFVRAGKQTGKVFFAFDASIGALIYRNNGDYFIFNALMKGATVGIFISPGIDIKVTQEFIINISAGLMIGSLNSYSLTIAGQTQTITGAPENLSRLDLSIGFRWCKYKK